jgi:hypothetical protein
VLPEAGALLASVTPGVAWVELITVGARLSQMPLAPSALELVVPLWTPWMNWRSVPLGSIRHTPSSPCGLEIPSWSPVTSRK